MICDNLCFVSKLSEFRVTKCDFQKSQIQKILHEKIQMGTHGEGLGIQL